MPRHSINSFQKKEDTVRQHQMINHQHQHMDKDKPDSQNLQSVDAHRGTITSIQITEVKSRQSRQPVEAAKTGSGQITMKPKTINMSYDPFQKPKKKSRQARNSQSNFRSSGDTKPPLSAVANARGGKLNQSSSVTQRRQKTKGMASKEAYNKLRKSMEIRAVPLSQISQLAKQFPVSKDQIDSEIPSIIN